MRTPAFMAVAHPAYSFNESIRHMQCHVYVSTYIVKASSPISNRFLSYRYLQTPRVELRGYCEGCGVSFTQGLAAHRLSESHQALGRSVGPCILLLIAALVFAAALIRLSADFARTPLRPCAG